MARYNCDTHHTGASHGTAARDRVTEGSTPTVVATSGPQQLASGSADDVSNWGGPGYFWLPSQDFDGLPLANFALQLGQHKLGHTP